MVTKDLKKAEAPVM
jgi:hypothetical protein